METITYTVIVTFSDGTTGVAHSKWFDIIKVCVDAMQPYMHVIRRITLVIE